MAPADPDTAAGTELTGGEPTVTAGDIARLAGVGRAAVSNWRRRFADFPPPVGGSSASPRYALTQVEQWLTRHDKKYRIGAADRLWQRLRGTADDPHLGELVSDLGELLLWLRDDRERRAVVAADGDAGRAPTAGRPSVIDGDMLHVVTAATTEQPPAQVFDFVHRRYRETCARRLPVTPAPVAELMAELAGVTGGSVLDPACGEGTTLVTAHAHGAARLLGQDLDTIRAGIAHARLLLAGAPAQVGIGDSLRTDPWSDVEVDAVLCEPPTGERSWGYEELADDPRWVYGLPPRGESELAWLQHCLRHVRPGGTVVLLLPTAVASRRAGRRIRANLLRDGALRAVIALPETATGGPAHLWILCRPGAGETAAERVLLLAADTAPASGPPVGTALADTALAGVVAAWCDFRRRPGEHPDAAGVVDLLDDHVDLDPAHRRDLDDIPRSVTFFPTARDELAQVTTGLVESLPRLAACPPDTATIGVGELVRTGALSIHQAPLRMATREGTLPVLTVNDLRLGRSATGRTTDAPGLVDITARDVIVGTDGPRTVVRVAADEHAVLGPHLLLLRADPRRLDPYFVAGCVRAAADAGTRSRSTTATRTGLRRTRLPRIPLDDQRRRGEAFRKLLDTERLLRDTNRIAQEVLDGGYRGLAGGSLRPTER